MGKIALGGAIGGVMLALAIASALERPQALPSPEPQAQAPSQPSAIPARCRTITMPESGCDAAWEANRRRFFGEDTKP